MGNFFPALSRTLKRGNSEDESIVQASLVKKGRVKLGLRGLVVERAAASSAVEADVSSARSPPRRSPPAAASTPGSAARQVDLGEPPVEEIST